MEKTVQQYDDVVATCYDLFQKKHHDYGSSWRILRVASLTDQIFIKASRIRSIQEKGNQKVEDLLDLEFVGIINYCIMATIQLELPPSLKPDLEDNEAFNLYHKKISKAKELMLNKNHDYGEAWREMRISSITDLILQKIFRIKQIEDNNGETIASEGLEANYLDILNYAVFSLILSSELNEQNSVE